MGGRLCMSHGLYVYNININDLKVKTFNLQLFQLVCTQR